MTTYSEIIDALPHLLLTEKMVIRDLLIEQIGLPSRRKEPTEQLKHEMGRLQAALIDIINFDKPDMALRRQIISLKVIAMAALRKSPHNYISLEVETSEMQIQPNHKEHDQ